MSQSFLCKGCGTGLVRNERVVLFHYREGIKVGAAQGKYDNYGQIQGLDIYTEKERGINSEDEVHKSIFELDSSIHKKQGKELKAFINPETGNYEEVYIEDFMEVALKSIFIENINLLQYEDEEVRSEFPCYNFLMKWEEASMEKLKDRNLNPLQQSLPLFLITARVVEFIDSKEVQEELSYYLKDIEKQFNSLKTINKHTSGIQAWHKYCYDKYPEELKDTSLSKFDPLQGCFEARQKFL